MVYAAALASGCALIVSSLAVLLVVLCLGTLLSASGLGQCADCHTRTALCSVVVLGTVS